MVTLEEQLEGAFVELDIAQKHRNSVKVYLDVLRAKDTATYEHCIRVGLLTARMARHMHLDAKALFFAGTLHDIGKTLIEPELLQKTEGFDEKDMGQMKKHPEYSYKLLRGVHEFSAEIVLRHHRFQKDGYPRRLPKQKVGFSKNTLLMIDFFARMLSLADFYDAISLRVNDKFGEKRKLDEPEIKSIMLMKNHDQRRLIEDLYVNGIFGEDANAEKTMTTTNIQDTLYNRAWLDWDGKRSPKETRRYVSLACALEPLSDKIGCTTRTTDISAHLKLEYFITAAINIGDAFEELAQRTLEAGRQPGMIYDLAYKAQADCVKNRCGGRVNQGMLEMLVPIVTAQMAFDVNYNASVDQLLEKAKDVLQNTSPEDVQELVKMKRLAYDLSAYHDRDIPEYPEARNVYSYYFLDLQNSKKPTSIKHNEEFVLGFPTIKHMYDLIMNSSRKIFNRKVEEAYTEVRNGNHREASVGLTADCIASAIYLVLSHHPKDKIIV